MLKDKFYFNTTDKGNKINKNKTDYLKVFTKKF